MTWLATLFRARPAILKDVHMPLLSVANADSHDNTVCCFLLQDLLNMKTSATTEPAEPLKIQRTSEKLAARKQDMAA
jgi:hypothetical protein